MSKGINIYCSIYPEKCKHLLWRYTKGLGIAPYCEKFNTRLCKEVGGYTQVKKCDACKQKEVGYICPLTDENTNKLCPMCFPGESDGTHDDLCDSCAESVA